MLLFVHVFLFVVKKKKKKREKPPPPPLFHSPTKKKGKMVASCAVLLVLVLQLVVHSFTLCLVTASCAPAPALVDGSVLNVAVLTWLIGEKNGWYKGGSIANTTATSIPGYGREFVQPHMLGVDLFVQNMQRQQPMPLNNNQSVSYNFVYINLGGLDFSGLYAYLVATNQTPPYDFSTWGIVDYANVGPTGFPWHIVGTTSPQIPGSAAYPGGMFSKVTSQDPAVLLANFGITTPFTFIIAPPVMPGLAAGVLANYNEYLAPKAVLINPFLSSQEDFVCDGLRVGSRSPDCLVPPAYAADFPTPRNRRQGARRFESLFSVLVDGTGNQQSTLDTFHLLNVRSIFFVLEALGAVQPLYFPLDCAASTVSAAGLLDIDVLGHIMLVNVVCASPTGDPTFVPPANCPPPRPSPARTRCGTTRCSRSMWPRKSWPSTQTRSSSWAHPAPPPVGPSANSSADSRR